MGFLDTIANWLAPSVPQPPVVPQPAVSSVPAELPRLAAKTAAEICKDCKPEAAAKELLTPQQTPSQFLAALQEKHLSAEMVKVLAHGLPDREGVAWAVQCAQKVAGTLPAADAQALQAAQAWVKNPSAEKQATAAAAAERTDFQGPGAWAAQAAAWAGEGTPKPPAADGVASPRLTPQAVAAAVLLASTIQARPQFAKRQLPTMQMPGMNLPSAADALHAQVPQIPGAAAQLHAGIAAPQGMAGIAASALSSAVSGGGAVSLPAVGGAAAHLVAPGLSGMAASLGGGVGSLPSVAGAASHFTVPGSSGMGAALGSVPILSSVSVPGLSGVSVPGMSAPAIPHAGQLSSLSQPNIPHAELPTIPPAVHAFMFKEQQDFVALGIAIASGKVPLV